MEKQNFKQLMQKFASSQDVNKLKNNMKSTAKDFAKEGEKFAKSKEANDLKNNVMNFFLDKAQGANNNLGDTIKNIRSKVNK